MIRKDITKDIIYEIVKKIYENNIDISTTKLFQLVAKELNCNLSVIIKRCGNFINILNKLNINIPIYYHNKNECKRRKDINKEIVYETIKKVYENNKGVINRKKLLQLVAKELNCSVYIIKQIYGHFDYMFNELNIPKYKEGINKELIYKTVIEVYGENNRDISITKLFRLVAKKLNSSLQTIKYRCGNFNNILKELNIDITKNYFNSEHSKNISEGLKDSKKFQKYTHSEEHSKDISLGLKNSEKFRMYIKHKKEKFSKEDIEKNMINKSKYEGSFSTNEFRNDNSHRDFGNTVMRRVTKESNTTLEEIAKENNITLLSRKNHWKKKENLGIELCKELHGEGFIQKYYKQYHSKPDFVPLDETKPIIDIKSTLGDICISQKEKYELIRKDVRFMVFDNVGKTELPQDRIMYMKDIIKSLPINKKLVFQDKYERIKNNIPLEQRALKDFNKNEVISTKKLEDWEESNVTFKSLQEFMDSEFEASEWE